VPLVTDEHIYVHMPSTGGSWMGRVLTKLGYPRAHVGYGHDPLFTVPKEVREARVAFATIRDPWSWYASWWRHAVTGRPKDVAAVAGGLSFRESVYALTHRDIGPGVANPGVYFPLHPKGWDHRTAWVESGVGFYTWLARHLYGDPWEVDVLLDTGQLYEGLSRFLGRAITREEFPPVNTSVERPGEPAEYDPEMVAWVREADGELAASLGYTGPGVSGVPSVLWRRPVGGPTRAD